MRIESKFTQLFIVYIFLVVMLLRVSSLGNEKPCFEAISDVNKEQLRRMDECAKKLNFKTLKERNDGAGCVMKCAFDMAGTLDADGYLDPIGMLIFLERNIPYKIHEWTRYLMVLNCFPHSVNLDPKEVTCKSYSPLGNCVANTFNLVCNPKDME